MQASEILCRAVAERKMVCERKKKRFPLEAIMKEVEKVTAFRLLPSGITRASANENPRLIVLYGEPKAGKSMVCSMIPGALFIDLAEEYKYLDAMKVRITFMEKLIQLWKEIRESDCRFTVIFMDNASLLYEMVKPYGLKLYRKTASGKYYQGDIMDIPFGGGWYLPRVAFMQVIEAFLGMCESLVLVGHMKTGDGEEG